MKWLAISKTVGVPEFQKLLLEIEKQPLISIFITRISPKCYNEELSW